MKKAFTEGTAHYEEENVYGCGRRKTCLTLLEGMKKYSRGLLTDSNHTNKGGGVVPRGPGGVVKTETKICYCRQYKTEHYMDECEV